MTQTRTNLGLFFAPLVNERVILKHHNTNTGKCMVKTKSGAYKVAYFTDLQSLN